MLSPAPLGHHPYPPHFSAAVPTYPHSPPEAAFPCGQAINHPKVLSPKQEVCKGIELPEDGRRQRGLEAIPAPGAGRAQDSPSPPALPLEEPNTPPQPPPQPLTTAVSAQ